MNTTSLQFRRAYPRRVFQRTVGLLCKGHYLLMRSGKIGEGGMSVFSDMVLGEGELVVVSFQIPGGAFVSLRAEIRSSSKTGKPGIMMHGLAFTEIQFALKRQIRAFVSSRNK